MHFAHNSMFRVGSLLFLLSALLLPAPARAARTALPAAQVKLDELTRDTQRHRLANGNVEVVWWIPLEYWEASLAQEKGVDPDALQRIRDTFGDYNVVAVLQASVADDLQYRFTSEDEVHALTVLIDLQGHPHPAIASDDLPPKLAATLAFLKPVLASGMGPMGKSMYFLVFPGNDAQGRRLIDPLADGRAQVKTRNKTHVFRLPLGSLLPDRHDAATGESFPGDFLYNPYTGQVLDAVQP